MEKGYAVLSIGRGQQVPYNSFWVKIRPQGGSVFTEKAVHYSVREIAEGGLVGLFTRAASADTTGPDFTEGENDGKVEVLTLEPGLWEIDQFVMTGFSPSNSSGLFLGGRGWESEHHLGLTFKVEPGRAVYIGAFTTTSVLGKNLFNWTVPAGGYVTATDRSERDLPIAKLKLPDLPEPEIGLVHKESHTP